MKRLLAIVGLLWCLGASAAEVIPPAPTQYFTDYAGVISPATAAQLNQTLKDFERETSSQVLVAIYPKMESDSSIDDYTVRVYRSWKVGGKEHNNGAVLFVFVQDHRMRIATGYGLEGALPDALCKRIIDQEITPRFKQGNFDGGVSAGVAAILAATKGEYKGTGRTANDRIAIMHQNIMHVVFVIFIIVLIVLSISRQGRRGGGFIFFGGGGGWSGGGGGGGWSGGGGFSGGGGSAGGGGASGSW